MDILHVIKLSFLLIAVEEKKKEMPDIFIS